MHSLLYVFASVSSLSVFVNYSMHVTYFLITTRHGSTIVLGLLLWLSVAPYSQMPVPGQSSVAPTISLCVIPLEPSRSYVHHLSWGLLLALQTGLHHLQAGLIPFLAGINVGFHPFMMGVQLGYYFLLNGLCPVFVYIYPGNEST